MTAALPRLSLVAADDVAPQAWKNGGGVTRELLRLARPGGPADDWLLRISLADIDADGAFSAFPGVRRWFAVISGAGVRLAWPAGTPHGTHTDLRPDGRVLAFDGALAPHCRLADGPTRDLNVMARDGAASAVVEAASLGPVALRPLDAFGIFALQALVLVRGDLRIPLPARTLAWHAGPDIAAWAIEAGSDALDADAPVAFRIGLVTTP